MTSLGGRPGPAADELGTPPALTLSRVRLGAGGPLASVRSADGRVVAVEVDSNLGGAVLDMDGRTVLPGLWDAHVHAAQWAGNRHRADLARPESARAVADIVRVHAAGLPTAALAASARGRPGGPGRGPLGGGRAHPAGDASARHHAGRAVGARAAVTANGAPDSPFMAGPGIPGPCGQG
ncbi:hypothetical protein ACIBW9_10215 [Streptomyces sp. NPDC049541]|uniref:hypothetical protein n=1 Tax=Streptomyces sp. NPDC049541 TaxID=3365594 RepID=UPI0037B7B9FA